MSADPKLRINITIGETELALARRTGESVSGYIRRLVQEDNEGIFLKIPVSPDLHRILHSSGVLEGARRELLLRALTQVLADHADSALMASRESLKAVMTGGHDLPDRSRG